MEQKKNKRGKLIIIFLVVLLILSVITVTFWDSIVIRVAPKAVLSSALTEVFARMEDRWQGNPLLMLAGSFNAEGKYRADVTADTVDELLGQISYDMTVYTDASSNQLLAEGVIRTAEMELALNAYFDNTFMAISSEDLLKGAYYGITYDTFSSDIRQFPLLTFLIPASTISEWETSISDIQTATNRSYALPKIPEISEEDIQMLLLGILALPSEVSETELELDDKVVSCHTITYNASGSQITDIFGTEAKVHAVFYLCENTVPKIELDLTSEQEINEFEIILGLDAGEDPFSVVYSQRKDETEKRISANVNTHKENNLYSEDWSIQHSDDEETRNLVFSYEWDVSNGDMLLTAGSGTPQKLNLKETEAGFLLKTEDLHGIIQAFTQEEHATETQNPVSCEMSFSKGSTIKTPEYKNLDQWSMEDLITLLGGIGSLIGLNMP